MEALLFPTAVWRRLWRDAAIVVAVVICLARATGLGWTFASDFNAYYGADLSQLYAGSAPGGAGAYLYSPLFAQLTEPLRWLPYNLALALWTGLELACLIYIAGPWSLLLFFPLSAEWMDGNVHLVMAAAVYMGMRRSLPWAVPVFTKLAPGVGLAWFAFRREWRALARAVATLLAIAGVSMLLAPDLWFAWGRMLLHNVSSGSFPGMIAVPLVVRLPLALALVAWAARTNRRWAVPLACGLAMPLLWVSALLAFGVAAVRLATLPSLGSIVTLQRRTTTELEPAPAAVPTLDQLPVPVTARS